MEYHTKMKSPGHTAWEVHVICTVCDVRAGECCPNCGSTTQLAKAVVRDIWDDRRWTIHPGYGHPKVYEDVNRRLQIKEVLAIVT